MQAELEHACDVCGAVHVKGDRLSYLSILSYGSGFHGPPKSNGRVGAVFTVRVRVRFASQNERVRKRTEPEPEPRTLSLHAN